MKAFLIDENHEPASVVRDTAFPNAMFTCRFFVILFFFLLCDRLTAASPRAVAITSNVEMRYQVLKRWGVKRKE